MHGCGGFWLLWWFLWVCGGLAVAPGLWVGIYGLVEGVLALCWLSGSGFGLWWVLVLRFPVLAVWVVVLVLRFRVFGWLCFCGCLGSGCCVWVLVVDFGGCSCGFWCRFGAGLLCFAIFIGWYNIGFW